MPREVESLTAIQGQTAQVDQGSEDTTTQNIYIIHNYKRLHKHQFQKDSGHKSYRVVGEVYMKFPNRTGSRRHCTHGY